MNSPATSNMIRLLRDLADELERGRGVAYETKIELPRGAGFAGQMQTMREYTLRFVLDESASGRCPNDGTALADGECHECGWGR